MISQDGAALIAQVYPIAILVIGLEVSRMEKLYAANRRGFFLLVVLAACAITALGTGIYSVILCVKAVAAEVGLSGFDADFVTVAGYLLAYVAGLFLLYITAGAFGILERLARGHAEKVEASPRRSNRQREDLRKWHPNGPS